MISVSVTKTSSAETSLVTLITGFGLVYEGAVTGVCVSAFTATSFETAATLGSDAVEGSAPN